MSRLFEKTVSAICYEVARSQSDVEKPSQEDCYRDVVEFVLGQWYRMPRFLAWPLRLATVAFAVRGLLFGSVFHRLPPGRRAVLIESWRRSSVGFCRDFIRFYRALTIMALYSREARL
ncbi:MAG: hypothetical protein JOZ31_04500 [Verrucomicrobia bacterium]|nr:hypothetical protein [Verrucomicrobiota bacterium]MBV8485334.1 hypothetical protein [Verrucomicrobiota bacterium]